jgi:hypothetical protein
VLRVVPHVAREEFVNAGVVLYCEARSYLAAAIELDEARLLALAPAADLHAIRAHLDAVARICAGHAEAGPVARLPLRERFRFLAAPRNTVVQPSPPHAGLSDAPEATLERMLATMVRTPQASPSPADAKRL